MESSGKSSSPPPSYMWSCGMASPSSTFPPHCRAGAYRQPSSGFHVLGTTAGHNREVDVVVVVVEEVEETTTNTIDVYCSRSSRRWRRVLKSLLREGRSKLRMRRKRSLICSSCNHSSPTTTAAATKHHNNNNNFGYDAVSYAKNFDDGLLDDEHYYHSYYFSSSNNIARCSAGNHPC